MKSLVLALTVLFATAANATSFQTHEEFAIQEFNKSAGVQSLTAEAKKAGFSVDENAKTVLLSGQCGFAGCSRIYLVSKNVQSEGANTKTDTINAIVTIPPHKSVGDVKVSGAFDSSLLLESIKGLNN